MVQQRWAVCLTAVIAVSLAGCRVTKRGQGKDAGVDIGTPFGSMQVKTDQSNAVSQIGLTPYPGAQPVREKSSDSGAADVNFSFGHFKLGVHAAAFQSADPPEKVMAFYKKDLSRYGDVLTCQGKDTVGLPARTGEGLTCDSDSHGVKVDLDDKAETQLRAGSERRQHMVSVEAKGGGTRIGLVALELPGSLKGRGSEERE